MSSSASKGRREEKGRPRTSVVILRTAYNRHRRRGRAEPQRSGRAVQAALRELSRDARAGEHGALQRGEGGGGRRGLGGGGEFGVGRGGAAVEGGVINVMSAARSLALDRGEKLEGHKFIPVMPDFFSHDSW